MYKVTRKGKERRVDVGEGNKKERMRKGKTMEEDKDGCGRKKTKRRKMEEWYDNNINTITDLTVGLWRELSSSIFNFIKSNTSRKVKKTLGQKTSHLLFPAETHLSAQLLFLRLQ